MRGAFARHLLVIHGCAVAVLAALSAGWFLLGVRPLMTEKQRAGALADQALEFRERIHDRVVKRDDRDAKRRGIEQELAAMTIRLRPASAVNAQLAEMTRLAETHRIVVERIEPGKPIDTPLAVRVPMKLAGRGSSPDAIRFLAALRATFPDIAVEGFDVTSRAGEVDAALQFDCVWYADRASEQRVTATASP